jgi:hypothetical protein
MAECSPVYNSIFIQDAFHFSLVNEIHGYMILSDESTFALQVRLVNDCLFVLVFRRIHQIDEMIDHIAAMSCYNV